MHLFSVDLTHKIEFSNHFLNVKEKSEPVKSPKLSVNWDNYQL